MGYAKELKYYFSIIYVLTKILVTKSGLLRRRYSVDVGVVIVNEKKDDKYVKKQLEVDFIANKGDKRYYIQSAYEISDEEKMKQ